MVSTDIVPFDGELELKEDVAQAMLETRGNLALVSRLDKIQMNAMALRAYVRDNPNIRVRYHELLAEQLQESGLLMAERILEMSELQQKAYGDVDKNIPADPKMAIELSKEISRLIQESKSTNISGKSALIITSKEGAAELLQAYLDGG